MRLAELRGRVRIRLALAAVLVVAGLALVAQDDAWALPEVRAHARELLRPRERSRLARSLELAARAGDPGFHDMGLVRSDRAWPVAGELRRLARAIGDPAVGLRAPAAALCRRLLCDAAASPLYNPNLPESDLPRLIGLIGAGILDRRAPGP